MISRKCKCDEGDFKKSNGEEISFFGIFFQLGSINFVQGFKNTKLNTVWVFVLKVEFYSQNNQNVQKRLKLYKNNDIIMAVIEFFDIFKEDL